MDFDDILTAIAALRGTHAELKALLGACERMAETGIVSDMDGAMHAHDAILDAVIAVDDCTTEAASGPWADVPREVIKQGH